MNELSIIIPTLNESAYLPMLLDSITRQQFAGRLQVIVVDGHSTDDTVRRARHFRTKLRDLTVLATRTDIGHQRNVGALQAKYHYLLFLDADVILPDGFLAALAPKISPDRDDFIACIVHFLPRMGLLEYGLIVFSYCLFGLARLVGTPVTNGDFILTTKTNHQRLHGFREGLLLGEDTDYGLRSFKSGARYQFLFSPHIIASPRRADQIGKIKLMKLWINAFMQARRGQLIYPGTGIDYPFGHYGPAPHQPPPKRPTKRPL